MYVLCISTGLGDPNGKDGIVVFENREHYSPRSMWREQSGVENTAVLHSSSQESQVLSATFPFGICSGYMLIAWSLA